MSNDQFAEVKLWETALGAGRSSSSHGRRNENMKKVQDIS